MSQTVPDSRIRRFIAARPITLVVVVAAMMLHAAVRWDASPEQDRGAAFRSWGLLEVQRSAEHPEFFGPFDLWAGEWGRIPLGGLHHAGWWHLAIVSAALLYLGGLLEPKLSSLVYGLFLLGAIFVTTLPRWLGADSVPVWVLGTHAAIGLSGVVFAQFACLLMLCRNDSALANRVGEGTILMGIAAGLGSLGVSLVIPPDMGLDNLAHLVGIPFGIVWGLAFSAQTMMGRRILIAVLLAAHVFLWPAFQSLMHPEDNARYHWWLAEESHDPVEKEAAYQQALEHDPDLAAVWHKLAELQFQSQRPMDAWQTLVTGLKSHPHLEDSAALSRQIWSAFETMAERRGAWQAVERELSGDAFDWGRQLLSPHQASRYYWEQEDALNAWQALMPLFQGEPADSEEARFAKRIWDRLEPGGEWTLALMMLDEELDLQRRAWHLAIIPHRDLISHYRDQGELLWAWQAVIEALRDAPAFRTEGKRIAQEIWKRLPTELRRERARKLVDDIFGKDRLLWQIELDILSEATRQRYRPDQAVELNWEDRDTSAPSDRILPFDPDNPESAALGISL